MASVLLTRLVLEGRPDDLFERAQVRESLRSYCALDVLATQRVVERLRDLASALTLQGSTTEDNVSDCLFCRIASGDLPATKVGETERVMAFRDVNLQAPTHVLLIPKQHVADSAATLDAAHGELLAELVRARRARGRGRGADRWLAARDQRGARRGPVGLPLPRAPAGRSTARLASGIGVQVPPRRGVPRLGFPSAFSAGADCCDGVRFPLQASEVAISRVQVARSISRPFPRHDHSSMALAVEPATQATRANPRGLRWTDAPSSSARDLKSPSPVPAVG